MLLVALIRTSSSQKNTFDYVSKVIKGATYSVGTQSRKLSPAIRILFSSMAPYPKQKRERTVSGQTLHKFFTSKSVVSQRAVAKTENQPGASTSSAASTRSLKHPEIIVIDSDSDSEPEIVQTITVKRRKLSPKNIDNPSSPNLTKVEDPVAIDKSVCQVKENVSTVSGQPIAVNGHDNSKEGPDISLSFGVPFLLNQSRSNIAQDDVFSPFGKPFLLTSSPLKENPPSETSEPPVASSSKTIPAAKTDIAVDIDLTLDDWDDGDDETVPGSTMEDDQEIEWVSYGTLQTEELSELDAPSLCAISRPDVRRL